MSAPALLACAVVALTLAVPIAASASSLEAAHRVRGAADNAALVAADAAAGWVSGEPCALAADVMNAAAAQLDDCSVDAAQAEVRVAASVQTVFGVVHARARAGPPDTG